MSTTKAIAAGKLAEEKTACLKRPRLYRVVANSTRVPLLDNSSSVDPTAKRLNLTFQASLKFQHRAYAGISARRLNQCIAG
ncbi:hypothetical protein [Mesorhizobium sophorae]|uniref:hypothetical protein n=1 Tax=Mesorhizobium sophorae TaxID=1300294 RepID=UPI00142E5D1A|nr:hypothetical protein [Mesorhizobium sophorae]